MTSARRTFLWMGALSVVTLLLAALRELVIARDLRASGAADLFFRGLIIVGSARAVGLSLYRARFIPVGAGMSARQLLRGELRTLIGMTVVAIAGLFAMLSPSEWRDPTAWVFVVCTILAVIGSAVRALAERAGFERRGFVLEWSLPIGAIAGAVLLGRGALGPTLGITVGMAIGLGALVPVLARHADRSATAGRGTIPPSAHTRWLLLDTILYINLGLLDGALSQHVFAEGGLALLNYGYLFVNAALAVPSAAATVVALRIAAAGDRAAHRKLRWWAFVGGALAGVAVGLIWAALVWPPTAALVDRAAGWSITAAIAPIVLWGIPFTALRLANTVGRQWIVANDPRRLFTYDLGGLALRAIVLVGGASVWGVIASPIALAVAEPIQLAAWLRRPANAHDRDPPR